MTRTTPPTLDVVLDGRAFLESPRWHDGRLWCSDFYTHEVITVDERGGAEVIAVVPGRPSGLGWLPDGRLLVVSMRDRRVLRREPDGTLAVHADLSGHAGGHLNDMVVDASGRAYVGNFGFDLMSGGDVQPAALVRVDPDGTATVAATDLLFPNGTVTLNGTLIVAETMGNRLTAFDVHPDGHLSRRRVWAAFGEAPTARDQRTLIAQAAVGPDGICADADGAVWVADAFHHRVLRVREGGEVLQEIPTGDLRAFAVMLGGHDGRTLYVCAAPTASERRLREARSAKLLACRVETPRAGRP